MRRVVIESPYKAKTWWGRWLNRRYARKCVHQSLKLGEAPFASHLFYTQVLNDRDQLEREWGIGAGFIWGQCADLTAVYDDRGISDGMALGIQAAKRAGRPIEFRSLKGIPVWRVAEQKENPPNLGGPSF